MSNIITEIEKEILPQNDFKFSIGDLVDVHYRIKEGNKERVQIFSGVVIARKGAGSRETFTVRKVVEGEGIEKIMPVHSPFIEKIDVKKEAVVRRAKLYYLRGRSAKDTRLKSKIIAKKK
ncbi:MAG: 50S ribosomal protein L19 [Planctomycetota bacterium]|nr:MAG: 50S ribosomal protein L19 [Planctomycetota bacterium]